MQLNGETDGLLKFNVITISTFTLNSVQKILITYHIVFIS